MSHEDTDQKKVFAPLPFMTKTRNAESIQNTTALQRCQGESVLAPCSAFQCLLRHKFTVCMNDVSGSCKNAKCNYWHGVTDVSTMLSHRDDGPQLALLTLDTACLRVKCHAHVRGAISKHLMRFCTAVQEPFSSSMPDSVDQELKQLALQYNAVIHTFNNAFQEQTALFYRCARRLLNPLPLLGARDAIVKACSSNKRFLLLESSTGSGKSTQVPHVAAWSLAERVAKEYDGAFARSGKQVCHFSRASWDFQRDDCHIVYITEHALLRLWEDRALDLNNDVYAVVLDEAHERTVVGDTLLALLKEKLQNTPSSSSAPFRLVVCSATLQTELYGTYLPGSCVIRSAQREHPVTVLHSPSHVSLSADSDYVHDTVNAIVAAVKDPVRLSDTQQQQQQRALSGTQRHVLAFLPTADDVESAFDELEKYINAKGAARVLSAEEEGKNTMVKTETDASDNASTGEALWRDVKVCLISGRQTVQTQREAFKEVDAHVRKVILATSVAETSITIDGVGLVIDSGLTRTMTYDPVARVTRLEVCAVTQSSAIQRAGRAGRTGPGICIRLYSQSSYDLLARDKPAALFTAPLHIPSLQLAKMNRSMEMFDWMEKPSAEAIKATLDELNVHAAFGPAAVTGGPPSLSRFGDFLLRLGDISVPVGKLLFDAGQRQPYEEEFIAVVALVAAVMHGSLGLFYCPRNKAAAFENMLRKRGQELKALEYGDVICTAFLVAQVHTASTQHQNSSTNKNNQYQKTPLSAKDSKTNTAYDGRGDDDDDDYEREDFDASAPTVKEMCETNFLRWRALGELRKQQCTFFRQATLAGHHHHHSTRETIVVPRVTCDALRRHVRSVLPLLASGFCFQLVLRRGDEKLDYQTVDATHSECLMVNRSFMKQQCLVVPSKVKHSSQAEPRARFDAYLLPQLCVFARVVSYSQSRPAFISLCTPIKQAWLPVAVQASVQAAQKRQEVVRTLPLPTVLMHALRPQEVQRWLSHELAGAACRILLDHDRSEMVLYCDRQTEKRTAEVLTHAVNTAMQGHAACCYEIPLNGYCRVTLREGGIAGEVLRSKEEYVTLVFSGTIEPDVACLPLSIPQLVNRWSLEWCDRAMPVVVRDGSGDGKWTAHVTFASSTDAKTFFTYFHTEDDAARPFMTVQPYCEQAAIARLKTPACAITVRLLWGRDDRSDNAMACEKRDAAKGGVIFREPPLEAVLQCQQTIVKAVPKETQVRSNVLDMYNKLLHIQLSAPNDRITQLTLEVLHRIRGPSFHYQGMFIHTAYTIEFPLHTLVNKNLQHYLRFRITSRASLPSEEHGTVDKAADVVCDALSVNGKRALVITCTNGTILKNLIAHLEKMTQIYPLEMRAKQAREHPANRSRAVAFQSHRLLELFNKGTRPPYAIRDCQVRFNEPDETLCFIGEKDTFTALQTFLDETDALSGVECTRLMVRGGPAPYCQSRAWLDKQASQCRAQHLPFRATRSFNTVTLIAPALVVNAARTDKTVSRFWQVIDGKEQEDNEPQGAGPVPRRAQLGSHAEEEEDRNPIAERGVEEKAGEEEDTLCPACFCPPTSDHLRLSCSHTYCTNCLKNMFNTEGGTIPQLPISCVAEKCNQPLKTAEVALIAHSKGLERLGDSARDELLKHAEQNGDELKTCPTAECKGVPACVTYDKRECAGCQLRFCAICSDMGTVCEWHDGRPHRTLNEMTASKLLEKLPLLPRSPQCDEPFYTFDGCFALKCSSNHGFCGFCMQDCGEDAHSHVKSCARNPQKGAYFGSIGQFYRCRSEDLAKAMMSVLRDSPAYTAVLADELVALVKERMSDDWPKGPIDEAHTKLREEPPSSVPAPNSAVPETSTRDKTDIPNTQASAVSAGRISEAREAVIALQQYQGLRSQVSGDPTHALWTACDVCGNDWELFIASAGPSMAENAAELYTTNDNASKIVSILREGHPCRDVMDAMPIFFSLVLEGLKSFRKTQPITVFRTESWSAELQTVLWVGEVLYWEFPAVCSRKQDVATRTQKAPRLVCFTVHCTLYAGDLGQSERVVLPAGVRLRVAAAHSAGATTFVDLHQESDMRFGKGSRGNGGI